MFYDGVFFFFVSERIRRAELVQCTTLSRNLSRISVRMFDDITWSEDVALNIVQVTDATAVRGCTVRTVTRLRQEECPSTYPPFRPLKDSTGPRPWTEPTAKSRHPHHCTCKNAVTLTSKQTWVVKIRDELTVQRNLALFWEFNPHYLLQFLQAKPIKSTHFKRPVAQS
jgi:predicted transcriptional regulator